MRASGSYNQKNYRLIWFIRWSPPSFSQTTRTTSNNINNPHFSPSQACQCTTSLWLVRPPNKKATAPSTDIHPSFPVHRLNGLNEFASAPFISNYGLIWFIRWSPPPFSQTTRTTRNNINNPHFSPSQACQCTTSLWLVRPPNIKVTAPSTDIHPSFLSTD